jgi:membrane-bound serine protease (ClpP class)
VVGLALLFSLVLVGARTTAAASPRVFAAPAAEGLARLVTHPAVAPILLTIALVALVFEVFSPGFGVAGVIGLASLGLFFGGYLVAGVGGWEVTALFLLGAVLLVVEAFIPGFGVFGIGGIISITASIYLASRSSADALRSLVLALGASAVLVVFLLRLGLRRGWFARLQLAQSLGTAQGYVARVQRVDLVGRTGVAVTALRPAGTARFGESLLDVVSEGMFIPAGTAVTVVRVEGPRVVVSAVLPGQ